MADKMGPTGAKLQAPGRRYSFKSLPGVAEPQFGTSQLTRRQPLSGMTQRRRALSGLMALVLFATATPRPGFSADLGYTQVSETGVLEGYVRLAGESRPTPTRVQNTTDPEICGVEHDLEDLVVSAENRGIQHVIATLVDVPANRVPATPPQRLIIDNRDCRFIPHVAVARVGDTVVAHNSDSTLHNTHYYGPLRSNVALPVEGMSVARVLQRPGMITVLCDVHGWMRAVIRVDEHPFHAVTDPQGFLRISGIPPGSYTLDFWHETLGNRQVQVEIQPNQTTRLDFEYAVTPSRP